MNYIALSDDNLKDVVDKYIEYYNEVEGDRWTFEIAYQRIHQIMTMEGSLCLLQYDENALVGFAMGYYKEFDDLRGFFLEEIVIFATHHNKGYGTQLMEKLETEVRANGASLLELISVSDPHHMHFYEKLGFYKAGNLVLMGKHFGDEASD